MRARTIRRIVIAVCVTGVAGMIAASVAGSNAVALTFGLITATAVLCLMVATAVGGAAAAGPDPGARVEALVQRLVGEGADEARVRELVGEAVRLGRSSEPPP